MHHGIRLSFFPPPHQAVSEVTVGLPLPGTSRVMLIIWGSGLELPVVLHNPGGGRNVSTSCLSRPITWRRHCCFDPTVAMFGVLHGLKP